MADTMAHLDDEDHVISSALWRTVCGNPSNNSWSKYRRSVGLNPENRRQELTRREAYLLLVRSKLRPICEKLGRQKPRDEEMKGYTPDSALFSIATAYAEALPPGGLNVLLTDAVNNSALSGEAVLTLLSTMGEVANRKLGERQIQVMISQAGLGRVLKRKIYPYAKVRSFIEAVSIASAISL